SSSAMLLDKQNILWIATQNGLLKLTAKKNPFKTLLAGSSIRSIFKKKDTLWVGILGNYTPPLRDAAATEQPPKKIIAYNSMAFYEDLRGHLWKGRYDKMTEYIPPGNTTVQYEFNYECFFQTLFQNPATRNYWAGTDSGLFRFDKEAKKIIPFELPETPKNLSVWQFHQNAEGIWLASSNGIFLMDNQRETILKHYTTADGLPSNTILHIYEDRYGIFWLGTADAGLVRWDRQNNSFRQYTRDDELSNNKIYAVYEDDYQTLWLPSDYGLMAFDKNTAITRIYLPENGIAHEEFNRFSHFQDEDGTLYFGGLNGITSFHPSDLRKKDPGDISLYITRIRVLENTAETFTDRTTTYKTTREISLKPGDRILEMDLTLLDYERSSENQYAYKLAGKQEQWVYTRTNRFAIINPPYGKYDLVIKARGASGIWSENPLSVPMYVQAPFYMQWWFILVSALTVVATIIIAVRWRIRKLEKDREHLEEEVQKRTRQIEQDKHIMEQQAEELKALDKAKTRFFANITHEFRTPLTLVAGPIEQIIENPPPTNTLKRKLSAVLNNTRNLMNLINQLLDLSKLEGGRMKVEIAHGDIVRFTRELVMRFQPLADKKQLKLAFLAHDRSWEIHTDIDKWTKIVYNLVANAIKFTPQGGAITVALKPWIHLNSQYIRLSVNDTGIGIAPENLEHIFDRFFQADASSTRLQGGTGIGLALVKELSEILKGSVSVKSTLDKGTEFTVTIPLANPPTRETEIAPAATNYIFFSLIREIPPEDDPENAPGEPAQKNSEKLQLLIIEDNQEMREYIRSCIDETRYNVSEAANGEEGIEKALKTVPDLIISDVMMPKKNGFEVTEAIRDHLATSHIPLILLTAKASLDSRLKGLERGADVYLTKPFSPQELTLRIRKLIELRKLIQHRYQNRETPPEENPGLKKEDGFIRELKDYILKNISEPALDVAIISQHFAMSRIQLYRKMNALIDMPVAHYIKSVRLEQAMQLLKQRQLNVTEIAYETGFSPSNFSKIFKKAYGKAPSEFY
ncbi:MAG: response regulator, partial [Sinomicrobium sp.]|nr:response regulator [Sinomicrobium sp.]